MLQAPTLHSLAIPNTQYSVHYAHLTSTHSVLDKASIKAFNSVYAFNPTRHMLVYKPVAKKVRTVPTSMPAEYRVVRQLPADPLAGLPSLPSRPPEFCPGAHFTCKRADKLDLDPAKWLWPEELKLVQWLVHAHERAFAWNASKRGCLNETCFLPYKIPMIPHTPWSQHNIPIPPATLGEVVHIIKEKIASGMYKPSTAAYQSCWFCVVKKDEKSLCLVHDLQPLNAVTIRNMLLPLFVEHLAESFAGYAVYSMMYLYSGYDQRVLHEDSRDLTTFGTPLGPHRLTTLPQGHANTVQVYQGNTAFILQHEIPEYMSPFVDDVPVKSMQTCYQREDSTYETIPDNPGIRRFIWEHCIVINCILQCLENVGATVSTSKFVLAAPTATIIGHKCTFEGHMPEESKVQKIRNWPEPTNHTQVRGFLGTCSVLRIFIHDFSCIARPLINLMKKDVPFIFGTEQRKAMQILKDAVLSSPALKHLDYMSKREVILAVDTSNIAIGFILLQVGEDGKRYPSRFRSIALTEVESCYSQAKLELYSLFRVLRMVRVFIFGVKNLTVEVDVKYIKGMINNPDLQPNATINRWIAGILLFSFKLVHISALKHKGVDGLSRCPPVEEDPMEDGDYEDWIDRAYSFSITLLNDRTYCIYGGCIDIRHDVHNTCFTSQTARAPILHVYFNATRAEDPKPEIPRSEQVRMQDALFDYVQKTFGSYG
jgi:hypothetical protein